MEVCVWHKANASYPTQPPFHPDKSFPDCPFAETGDEVNTVFEGIRELFRLQGLDRARFGTKSWNPLGALIRRGEKVVLKPNLIKENHPRRSDGWLAMLTHGSVIRAVADYVFKATGEGGEVIVADAPQTDSSFAEICRLLGLHEIQRYYRSKSLRFQLVDLRQFEWRTVDDVVLSRRKLSGDPNDYVTLNLGKDSLFYQFHGEGRYYGADYDTQAVNRHHRGEIHEYVISGSVLRCDVFINLPKMKTHKKTGVTLSLKNVVGINGDKNCLPHYTEGTPSSGGDQFPGGSLPQKAESLGSRALRQIAVKVPFVGPRLYRLARRAGARFLGSSCEVVRSGNWWGNDTCWRMCLDLNRILLYAQPDGVLRKDGTATRKRYLSIVDGIIAGEGDGPIEVEPVNAGVLLMGINPVSVDAVAATIMGFDPLRLPIIKNAFAFDSLKIVDGGIADIRVVSNRPEWCGDLGGFDPTATMVFRPHFGWRGKIELDRSHPGIRE